MPILPSLASRHSSIFCYRRARGSEIDPDRLQRHDDLAEMLVGFHVLERLADIVECEHLVDRQLQFALLHRSPDILADLAKDLADFLDRAGAEGDADIGDAARRMQVEIEIGAGAAEPADIDDAALDPGGRQILARGPA